MAALTVSSRTVFCMRDSVVVSHLRVLRNRTPAAQEKLSIAVPHGKVRIFHSTSTPQACSGRPVFVASSSRRITAAVSAEVPDVSRHREDLKEQLLIAVDSITGNLNEECLAIVAELQKVNPNGNVLVEKPELPIGVWKTVRATFKGTGRKGESKADIGYRGAPLTLGRMCFNMFKPASLDVFMGDSYNKIEGIRPDAFHIMITFTFDDPRGGHLPPIEGIVVNTAAVSNLSPMKQEISFHSSVLKPRNPERDLEVWKEIFGENSGMDEGGQIFRSLGNAKDTIVYLYIDDNFRITLGGRGAHILGRRLEDQEPEILALFSPMKPISATST